MPIKGMTQAEIDEATRAQVAAGASSTDRASKLPGETSSEANARITAAYKEMTAKPILSQEQLDAGAQVKFVRTGAGGVGENMVIVPIAYDGPPIKVTEFTPGVIPESVTRTTGTSVGYNPDDYKTAEDMQRVAAKLAQGGTLTPDEQAFVTRGVTATSAPAVTAKPEVTGSVFSRLKADAQEPTTTESISAVESAAAARAAEAAANAANAANAAELQAIVAKLGRGETLTAEEAAAIGTVVTATASSNVITTTPKPGVIVTTTAKPGVIVTTLKPGIVTTAKPGVIVTTTANPNIVTTTANPNIVITTAKPGVIVTTVAPGGIVTTASPGVFTYKASDGTVFTDQAAYVAYQKLLTDKNAAATALAAENTANRQSAYDLLYAEFSKYGLGSLVEPLRGLIQSGSSPAEFTIKLRESDAYKKRFSANQQRISKGLKAINEAEYIGLEDQYQNILRNAGLPDTYWKRGDLGVQEGFTNFIANDVSAVELEDRVSTAQQRLIYANPEVSIALKTFYPDISNGDLLAYALDPTKGLEQIKRRITAAEIGSSAVQLGLATNVTDAEYLARYGVNKAQAQQGYRTAAEILPTASKLGDIYSRQGLGAYTQQTAEQEIFNVPGAAEAAAKRRKLSELEQASFSGKAGMGALARDRAGSF
jgi:hypothetical protein